ncbi:MAG: sigma-70 family RNA polymerase sigma factor [Selenomonadaceae bacterium]|nr:sigma-70 family RNA polymerase sigma factor [Selenomonadaceae bacterium]
MNIEAIRKAIAPYVVDGEMTWDDFDKIFNFLPLKEQYSISYAIQDDLKIEFVDEMISLPAEENFSDEIAPLVFRAAKEIKASNKILIRLIQSGDEQARQDLCIKNRGLVEKFAARYEKLIHTQLTFEDLTQEGFVGMLRAAEKFDFGKETEFSTYATWWIVQAITRAIADTGLAIRLPVHMAEKILKASRFEKNFLAQGFGLRQRIELIAQEMELKPEDVSYLFALRAAYMNIVSLDKPIEEDGDSLLRDFIEDTNTPDPAEAASFILLKEQLEEVLATLTQRERNVLSLRFGLEDGHERTLEEVGKKFNVTRERIRQIEAKALRKLRHPSRSKNLKDFL